MDLESRVTASFNRGLLAQKAGDLGAAVEIYEQLWRTHPDIPGLSWSYANVLLSLGDIRGWELMDYRPERIRSLAHKLGFPEWRGENLSGKRLFIWPEQGFGDQILASRYFTSTGASSVTVCCDLALRTLWEHMGLTTVVREASTAVYPHDFWCLPLSLPRWVSLPDPAKPYIVLPSKPAVGFGVAWSGNALPDPGRSLPEHLGKFLLTLPGAVSLAPEDSGANDFLETADLISGLSHVVTIDTSVAHLAGAMGKPVWLLLQKKCRDWRWEQRLYRNVRVFRQATQDDWTDPVNEVASLLSNGP